MIMKRFLKYTITLLVVFMLVPMITNAQTIKRSKQKTEHTQKPPSSTPKSSSPKPEKSKTKNGNFSSKKNVSTSAPKHKPTKQEKEKSQNVVSYTNVTFTCNVQNAQLFVDGHNLGRANGKYQLTASNHLIRVKSDGYQERIIFFDASCTHNLYVELFPE